MVFRKLEEADYPEMLEQIRELAQIHIDARPDYFLPRDNEFPKKDYDEALADPGSLFLGAFTDTGSMVGFARAIVIQGSGEVQTIRTARLDDIYVLPEYRRKGIAAALFQRVEQWAKAQGAQRLDLAVWEFNKTALCLYRAMGMTPQRHYYEKNL